MHLIGVASDIELLWHFADLWTGSFLRNKGFSRIQQMMPIRWFMLLALFFVSFVLLPFFAFDLRDSKQTHGTCRIEHPCWRASAKAVLSLSESPSPCLENRLTLGRYSSFSVICTSGSLCYSSMTRCRWGVCVVATPLHKMVLYLEELSSDSIRMNQFGCVQF